LLIPLGTPAVVLIFGAKWRVAGYGVMALGVYAAARALDSIGSETWKAANRPDMLPRMHGLSLGLTVCCVAVAAPFGLVPVTVGIAVAAIGVGTYAVYGMSKVVGIRIRWLLDEIWPPAIAASVMAGALFIVEHGFLHSDRHGLVAGVATLLAEALAGTALYLTCLWILSPSCRGDLLSAGRHLRRRSADYAGAARPVALAR
jgi:O-antigen/teichoic acid export membrane protein